MDDTSTTKGPVRDELLLLGSRQQANIGSARDARAIVTDLREHVRAGAVRSGEDAHRYGTKLVVLYKSLAEQHYDRKSFLDFVRLDVGLARSTFYDWIRVARYATATQARWGVATCLAAGRLIEFFRANPAKARAAGLKRVPETLTDLVGVSFPIDARRTLRFEGDTVLADDVDDALAFQQGGVQERAGLTQAQRAGNDKLREAIARKAALAGVEARLARRKGKNVLHLVIPSGGNVVEIARVIARALEE